MNDLIPINPAVCELSTTSANFKPETDFKDWLEAGRKLCEVSACSLWWIGDWLNYGEAKWGKKYEAAVEVIGYDYVTLKAAAWVARSIKVSTRIQSLSWSHHREVASEEIKDKAKWLRKAQENNWTVSELRRAIRESGAEFHDNERSRNAFNVMKWAMDGVRWLKTEMNTKPIEQWPKEQREAIKKDLQPLIEIYEKL